MEADKSCLFRHHVSTTTVGRRACSCTLCSNYSLVFTTDLSFHLQVNKAVVHGKTVNKSHDIEKVKNMSYFFTLPHQLQAKPD